MRTIVSLLASSVVFSGCAISSSGTEESITFSPIGTGSVEWTKVYKPYEDLPFTLEFSCPGKAYSVMISPVIPLPPVVPVSSINKPESFVQLVFPEREAAPIQGIRIVLADGKVLQFQGATVSDGSYKAKSEFLTTFQFKNDCSEFEGGELQIEGFDYLGKSHPPTKAKLQFKSTFRVDAFYLRS